MESCVTQLTDNKEHGVEEDCFTSEVLHIEGIGL